MDIKSTAGGPSTARAIREAQERTKQVLAKIASGHRINSASDDAASLAIAEGLEASGRSLRQAQRNVLDGVSILQTADSALSGASDIVGRLRELAVQASNGTLSDDQRASIQGEAQQLTEELDRIAQTTEYNGRRLFQGEGDVSLQVGTEAGQTEDIQFTGPSTDELGIGNLDLSSADAARGSLSSIDDANQGLSEQRAEIGAEQSGLERVYDNLDQSAINTAEAESRLRDADIAATSSQFTGQRIRAQAAVAAHSQANVAAELAGQLIQSKI